MLFTLALITRNISYKTAHLLRLFFANFLNRDRIQLQLLNMQAYSFKSETEITYT